ncbi:MAG TPA: cytochrome c [Gaiella sp.]|jgi:mono/diheme cytochrome c family protein
MRRLRAPVALLVVVTLATFGLAKWHPFSPSAPAATSPAGSGDPTRGARVFASTCAGCHGADAQGKVGPALRGSGLTAEEVAAVVASGRGVMPAGLVSGQQAADVAAYVATLSQ